MQWWYINTVGEVPTIEDGDTEDYTYKNITEENIMNLISGAKETKRLTVIIDAFRASTVEAYINKTALKN